MLRDDDDTTETEEDDTPALEFHPCILSSGDNDDPPLVMAPKKPIEMIKVERAQVRSNS